jgi:uncharacterized repeat protein (TIGR03803 family)
MQWPRAKQNAAVIRPISRLAATLIACLTSVAFAPAVFTRAEPQGPPVYQQLKSFGRPAPGQYPFARMIQGTDGTLYGTASVGGSGGYGTVFKMEPDGTGFTVLQSFDNSTTGGYLESELIQGTDGALYGTAERGGSSGYGTLFKLNPDGTGFTVILNFDDSTTGANPYAGLIQGTDGALYGTASNGGSSGYGTVFKVNTDGSGFTVLRNFTNSKAAYPRAGLMQGTDGALYGTASAGGSGGYGALFKLNPDGGGYKVLYSFDGWPSGANPFAGLIQGTDGALYGTATSGGSSGHGTVFKLNPDGTGFNVLLNFDNSSTGEKPYAGLTQGTDGALYGTAYSGSSSRYGTVFKLNSDGTGFTVLLNFDYSTTGANPYAGLIQGSDGVLYGTAVQGGTTELGTLFKLNSDGTGFTVLKTLLFGADPSESGGYPGGGLMQGTDGALYGTTSSGGKYGYGNLAGYNGYGTVFKVNSDGTGFTVLLNFDSATTGEKPYPGLTQGTDGALYGTTMVGGSGGGGTVFKLNPDGTGVTVLVNLDHSTTGWNSDAGLMQGTDGALYGTTAYGGSNDSGTVFKLNLDGTGFAVLQDFNRSTTGATPVAKLIQGTDGALYGTAAYGGSNDSGTVFKLNPDGTGFAVLQNFDGAATGASPEAELMQGTDGALYGTAYYGGSNGYGTLFKLKPDGTGFTVLLNFDNATTGAKPLAGVIQGTDGALYGTANSGGSNDTGTVFKLNPDGTGFAVLLNCDGSTTGAYPRAAPMQGTDGNLYGTTGGGGDFDLGIVFRLVMDCTASWSNYGAGFAGTHGVPDFTSSANPVLGTTITFAIDNSLGSDTVAFLIAGLNRAAFPFKQGTVLVDPFRDWLLVLPLSIPAPGLSLDVGIPDDESLCGLRFDSQVLEIDSGAAQGVSFTSGLELVLGD